MADKKMYEIPCLRCQKSFKYPEDANPVPHLCPVCDKFFKDFNSQLNKKIHKIIPKKVTENVTITKIPEEGLFSYPIKIQTLSEESNKK